MMSSADPGFQRAQFSYTPENMQLLGKVKILHVYSSNFVCKSVFLKIKLVRSCAQPSTVQ